MINAINRYKLKDDVTMDEILSELKERNLPVSEGGKYINDKACYSTWKVLVDGISINIAFPENPIEWDDYEFVLVMDDDFCQPYTPFYRASIYPYLLNVVGHFNKFMDSLTFLERKG